MPLWIPITSWGKVVTTKQKEKPKTNGRKPKANTCKTQQKKHVPSVLHKHVPRKPMSKENPNPFLSKEQQVFWKPKSFQGKPDIKTLNLAPASSNVINSPCKIVFKDRKNTAAKEKLHPTTEKFTSLKEQIAPPPEQWKTGVVWNGSQRWEGFFGKRYVLAHFFCSRFLG